MNLNDSCSFFSLIHDSLFCYKYLPLLLKNRHVVLITNVKPGKLRDVMSAGLVCSVASYCNCVLSLSKAS